MMVWREGKMLGISASAIAAVSGGVLMDREEGRSGERVGMRGSGGALFKSNSERAGAMRLERGGAAIRAKIRRFPGFSIPGLQYR